MQLRQAFFRWLVPAAFVLPLWLIVGWIITGSSAWALLWVLVSVPIVFLWELLLALLVRARGTVRATRAVSWTDVGLFGAWHLLIVALGTFHATWWWPTFAVAVLVGLGLLWAQLAQLWRESRPAGAVLRTPDGVAYIPAQSQPTVDPDANPTVIVVTENTNPSER